MVGDLEKSSFSNIEQQSLEFVKYTLDPWVIRWENNGKVQSYYISENHEPIVSPEVWEKVQEVREQRKRDRNIGQDSTVSAEIEDGGVLPSVNRPRRTVIKL